MSDMKGNPYIRSFKASTADGAVITKALFALAYEQRTANLLHALEISLRAQGVGVDNEALQEQIVARLGLNGEDDE